MRLAYASFGINTPVMSVVLSVFMTGLGLGSWAGGKISSRDKKPLIPPLFAYAMAEFLIGVGAFLVPRLFLLGEKNLLPLGGTDSLSYLVSSATVIFFALIPWCLCMGATFPLMMDFIRKSQLVGTESFSFLYLFNVLGAMAGVFLTSVALIERLGFRGTLTLGAVLNFLICLVSLVLYVRKRTVIDVSSSSPILPPSLALLKEPGDFPWVILPMTGFTSMALEVVWTRAFIPILRTEVYSFASLIFTYLLGTVIGSFYYRRDLKRDNPLSNRVLLSYAALFSFFPVVLNDPRLQHTVAGVLVSLLPFCVILGYLTPKLVDQISAGDPEKAGRAYALNILGCILGPLVASYLLLPWISSKFAMVLLALPFLAFAFNDAWGLKQIFNFKSSTIPLMALALLAQSLFGTVSYEDKLVAYFPEDKVYRDYSATVIAAGQKMNRWLFVNGITMTMLTPATKVMAHWPLEFLDRPPKSALAICFGMGTSFRSLLSWNIDTTVVDLTPSVFKAFPYFHANAGELLKRPNAHWVVDDGRRFLERSPEKYDVITVDPPPPVEAAGSSLLYSVEFYSLAKAHLEPGGVLQQWFPGGDAETLQAVARSLVLSFPYVKVFRSAQGWGYHFIASSSPLMTPTVGAMISKMPLEARRDMMEWFPPAFTIQTFMRTQLEREIGVREFLSSDPGVVIRDDRPYNEYFLLRRAFPSSGA